MKYFAKRLYQIWIDIQADIRYSGRYPISEMKFRLIWPFLEKGEIDDLKPFEQRVYSQNGEDGIIKIIFYNIGTTNKFCVEFGVGDGKENNTRYLIERKGWNFLQMDFGPRTPPNAKKEFVTADNINDLFKKYIVPKEFDLLSIDIDSNDYWVWKAIKNYLPRVVVIEYNASIPPDQAKTIEYDPKAGWDGTDYFGASLLALEKLGKEKGYSLIGCDSKGINAFFIRNDVLKNYFVAKSAIKAYRPPGYGRKLRGKHQGHPPSERKMISV